MAKTAILNAATLELMGVGKNKAEIAAIMGEDPADSFVQVTKKTFVADETYASFEELCGEVTEVDTAEAGEVTEKAPRARAETLAGEYHVIKQPAPVPEGHGREGFIAGIMANTDVEAAKAACPDKTPRAKNGFFTFGSEFRYLITRGVIAMGPAPENNEPAAE